jgi:diapolycopene oxygenase
MTQDGRAKKVIVIGAGLGGISVALALALRGYAVQVFEKNRHVGGKLNVLKEQGYTFDMGPSILTLPHIFERVFEAAGRKMQDYVPLRPLRPHWRNFFEDGTTIDLFPEPERMAEEAVRVGEEPRAVEDFLAYSAKLYDLVNRGYFEQGLDTAHEFASYYGLAAFPQFDLLHSMHGRNRRFFKTGYFTDIFDFFIKYVGSSAYRAPAFMNCLPTIQFRYDLWYVMGGLYGLAEGLQTLMQELGIEVNLEAEVTQITCCPGTRTVSGVRLKSGEAVTADRVVSNMEVIPAYGKLLGEEPRMLAKLQKRFEPACSGLVVDIGLDCKYPQLAHHNFFFSGSQKKHFHDVFQKKVLPHDPTIYLVAASQTDPSVAPEGCDGLKILPHIPHLDPAHPVSDEDYHALKERVYDKLERMGLQDLRRHIVYEHVWTPRDIERMYYSNRGSIYGVVSDRFKNLAFKAPKKSRTYEGLYFVGGSVNPGGGMPMVFLCGQNTARLIAREDGMGD